MKNRLKWAFFLGVATAAFWVVDGWAFCVQNDSEAPLFARSLDSTKFQVDIPPGEKKCCVKCVNPQRDKTTLLIVSGYVPVSRNSQPGWQGECRVKTKETGNITVTGSLEELHCQ
ncbi:MAG: hypothetical protein HQL72_13895 [Magnetococcales bacterium]|nr:hypothetical protein [Magnetococcales bacterium]